MSIDLYPTENQQAQLKQIGVNINQVIENYYRPDGFLERYFGAKRLAEKKAYVKHRSMLELAESLKQFGQGHLSEKAYDQWMLKVAVSEYDLRKSERAQDFELDRQFSQLIIDALTVFKAIFKTTSEKYQQELAKLKGLAPHT